MAVVAAFALLALVAGWILWPLLRMPARVDVSASDTALDSVRARQHMLAARWEDLESDRAGELVSADEYSEHQKVLKEEIKTLQKQARTVGMVLLVWIGLCRVACAQLPAETGGAIDGRVVSNDPTFHPRSDVEVEMHTYRKGKAGPPFQTQVDSAGRFTMQGLLVHPDIRYWFSIKALGMTYCSNVVTLTNDAPRAQVEIPVFAVDDTPGHLHVLLDHDLFKVETRSADVLELVGLEQPDAHGYSGGMDGGVLIPLPPGYVALEQVDGTLPVLEVPGKGALIAGPIPPGRTVVAFAYRVPVGGDHTSFVRKFPLPVDRYGVFLNDSAVTMDAPDMVAEGPKVVDGRNYHVYAVKNAGPDHEVVFTLSNFPRPPRDWRPWYAVAMGIVLLGGMVYGLRRPALAADGSAPAVAETAAPVAETAGV